MNHHFSENSGAFEKIEERIFEINPSYGRFYYTLAESLVSRGKYQEGVDFSRKAISLDRELWGAYASLGMNLTRIGNLREGLVVRGTSRFSQGEGVVSRPVTAAGLVNGGNNYELPLQRGRDS